jgi:hypothetical protein
MLQENEILLPDFLPDPEEEDAHELAAPAPDLLDLLATAASRGRPGFALREWQSVVIPPLVHSLFSAERPVLLTAAVGTGKTIVAGAAMLHVIYGNTGYMAKVIVASPLVELAQEQFTLFESWMAQLNRKLPTPRKLKVALRAGDQRRGDIRRASIIVGTYEYVRNLLADADAPIYLNAPRMHRTWADAIGLIVIDEAHMVMSGRGIVVTSIIALANHHHRPLLMMTGTTHSAMTTALKAFYQGAIDLYTNPPDQSCQQISMEIRDEKVFQALIVATFMLGVVNGKGDQGMLVFCKSIKETWKFFAAVFKAVKKALQHPSKLILGPGVRRLEPLRALMSVEPAQADADFDVTWSTVLHHEKDQASSLAAERIMAKSALALGMAYVWRDVGDNYYSRVQSALTRGQIRLLFSTSKLAAGVNIPGIRHVAVQSHLGDAAELAQMIGRCGRNGYGFAYLLGRPAPTAAQVETSMKAPDLSQLSVLVDWWFLKKAWGPALPEARNVGRWRWTYARWSTFFLGLPLPCFAPDDIKQTVAAAMTFMCSTSQICVITEGEEVHTYATVGALRVAECDASSVGIALHIAARADARKKIVPCAALPWLACLTYWAVQLHSLPALTWAGRDKSIIKVVPKPARTRAMADLLLDVESACTVILNSASAFGSPFAAETDSAKSTIVTLAVITALVALGVEVPFRELVPRRSVIPSLSELEPVAELVKQCCQGVGMSADFMRRYVAMPGETIVAVGKKMRAVAGAPGSTALERDAPNPLFILGLPYNNNRPDAARILRALVANEFVPKDLFNGPDCAFSPTWARSLRAPQTAPPGRETRREPAPDSA